MLETTAIKDKSSILSGNFCHGYSFHWFEDWKEVPKLCTCNETFPGNKTFIRNPYFHDYYIKNVLYSILYVT